MASTQSGQLNVLLSCNAARYAASRSDCIRHISAIDSCEHGDHCQSLGILGPVAVEALLDAAPFDCNAKSCSSCFRSGSLVAKPQSASLTGCSCKGPAGSTPCTRLALGTTCTHVPHLYSLVMGWNLPRSLKDAAVCLHAKLQLLHEQILTKAMVYHAEQPDYSLSSLRRTSSVWRSDVV